MEGVRWLDYRDAARRVGRDVRTLKRWAAAGMPMGWATRDGQPARVVREDVLLAWYRQRLLNDPVHQKRMARRRRELAAALSPASAIIGA